MRSKPTFMDISEVPLPPERLRLFLSHIVRDPATDCWLWQGTRMHYGHGRVSLCTKGVKFFISAHRISFLLSGRRLTDEAPCVLHCCDNPPCVNPNHLSPGTQADNNHDMLVKGRQARGLKHGRYTKPEATARGDRNGSRTKPERLRRGDNHPSRIDPSRVPRGAKHWKAIVTEDDVREIRRLAVLAKAMTIPRTPGSIHPLSHRGIGLRFGITPSAVDRIVHRKAWKWVK